MRTTDYLLVRITREAEKGWADAWSTALAAAYFEQVPAADITSLEAGPFVWPGHSCLRLMVRSEVSLGQLHFMIQNAYTLGQVLPTPTMGIAAGGWGWHVGSRKVDVPGVPYGEPSSVETRRLAVSRT